MSERLSRSVIEPVNPKPSTSRATPTCRIRQAFGLATTFSYPAWAGGSGHPRVQSGPIAEQIRQTLRNMAHVLESAGSSLDRVVKMTVVLADSADYDKMNQVWREFFPTDPPARTTCALQLSNGNGVEIECIALAGEGPS